jgi:hypothetical protein
MSFSSSTTSCVEITRCYHKLETSPSQTPVLHRVAFVVGGVGGFVPRLWVMNGPTIPQNSTVDADELLGDDRRRVSLLRVIAGILFGLFYGGSLMNGFDRGLGYAWKEQGDVLNNHPALQSAVLVASAILAGFLAAYCGQAAISGYIATALTASLFFALHRFVPDYFLYYPNVMIGLMLSGGFLASHVASRIEIPIEDLKRGRLFGVSWKHWLWLFIPWQMMLAQAIFVVYPPSLLEHGRAGWWTIAREIVSAPLYLLLMVWATVKALESIRADSQYARWKSALAFLGWFLLVPIVISVLRRVGWF